MFYLSYFTLYYYFPKKAISKIGFRLLKIKANRQRTVSLFILFVFYFPDLHNAFILVILSQSITLTVPSAVKFSGVTVVSPFSTVTG